MSNQYVVAEDKESSTILCIDETSCRFDLVMAKSSNEQIEAIITGLSARDLTLVGQAILHAASYFCEETDMQTWLKEHRWQLGVTL